LDQSNGLIFFAKKHIIWKSIGLQIKRNRRGKRGGKIKTRCSQPNNSSTVLQIKPVINQGLPNKYSLPRVYYTNACSLSQDKLDNLLILSQNYDVLAISETWSNSSKKLSLPNFNVFECFRPHKTGGGVAILVKDTFPSIC